MLHDIEGAKMK